MGEAENIIIRRAARADLEAVRGILNYYVEQSPFLWTKRVRSWRDIVRFYFLHQSSDRTPFIVAERGREILGFAALSPVSASEGWEHVAEDMIYLRPGHTGNGLGTKLLEAVMQRGQLSGLWAVTAKIDAENARSLALHLSFGFEEYGILKGVGIKLGQRRSCVHMVYYF